MLVVKQTIREADLLALPDGEVPRPRLVHNEVPTDRPAALISTFHLEKEGVFVLLWNIDIETKPRDDVQIVWGFGANAPATEHQTDCHCEQFSDSYKDVTGHRPRESNWTCAMIARWFHQNYVETHPGYFEPRVPFT